MEKRFFAVCSAATVFTAMCYPAAGQSPADYPDVSATPGEKITHSPDPLSGYRWETTSAGDGLERYTLHPVAVNADVPENILTGIGREITVTGPCNIMFDFGQVNAAWFEFDADEIPGVTASISEFNEPAVFNVGSQHPEKTAPPVRHDGTYRLELNDRLYEGVRFAWIHIPAQEGSVTIRSPRLVCQTKPTNYMGSFSCSDTMLTRAWYTGAYTVKLNLLEDHFGAILMERSDRHSWTGDAHTSQAASMVAFGNWDFVKQNLRYTSEQYNGIASYSLYWVLSLIDYYNYTGDAPLMEEMLANACAKLDGAYGHFGTDGTVFYGWDERLGAGFEGTTPESRSAYMMLSISAWNEFADAMQQYGRSDLAEKYRAYAGEKAAAVRSAGTDWWASLGVHAASDAVKAGFMTPEEEEAIWPTAFADRMQRLSYSPFNQYFIIQAMARMGRLREAVTTVDDCWGGQLRYGATTFFEVFRPSWNDISAPNDAPPNNQCGYTSLTHPWSAGVTKWLSEEVLGIKPTGPGFGTFTVRPYVSQRITRVEGDVPTPNGAVSFSLDTESGDILLTVPEGTTADLHIPKAGRCIKKISFAGRKLKRSSEDADYVYFTGLGPGTYKGRVVYTGEWPVVEEEPFRYAAVMFREDASTRGSWQGRYGSKGYMLFNYDSLSHRRVLPAGVRDITLNLEGNVHWVSDVYEERTLLQPDDSAGNLGAIYTQDPIPCRQTLTIDIRAERDFSSEVSLYMVDWERDGRRSAIEVFNLDTRELLMPVYMIRDYAGGKYITFPINGPVRIRLDQVRGPNAAVSAVFFD